MKIVWKTRYKYNICPIQKKQKVWRKRYYLHGYNKNKKTWKIKICRICHEHGRGKSYKTGTKSKTLMEIEE